MRVYAETAFRWQPGSPTGPEATDFETFALSLGGVRRSDADTHSDLVTVSLAVDASWCCVQRASWRLRVNQLPIYAMGALTEVSCGFSGCHSGGRVTLASS